MVSFPFTRLLTIQCLRMIHKEFMFLRKDPSRSLTYRHCSPPLTLFACTIGDKFTRISLPLEIIPGRKLNSQFQATYLLISQAPSEETLRIPTRYRSTFIQRHILLRPAAHNTTTTHHVSAIALSRRANPLALGMPQVPHVVLHLVHPAMSGVLARLLPEEVPLDAAQSRHAIQCPSATTGPDAAQEQEAVRWPLRGRVRLRRVGCMGQLATDAITSEAEEQ